MTEELLTEEIEAPVVDEETLPLEPEEPTPEPPKFSGLLTNIFPDGTVEYDGQIGAPEDFPLTEAELAEVGNPGEPIVPAPPSANYHAFWDALMVSTIYTSIREQSFVSLPMNTLATEFIAIIGDAKAGRANEAAILNSINAILATGTFTQEHIDELLAALKAGNLESTYFPV
jgi:hypothetical protein